MLSEILEKAHYSFSIHQGCLKDGESDAETLPPSFFQKLGQNYALLIKLPVDECMLQKDKLTRV
jgi:hypothetical protein